MYVTTFRKQSNVVRCLDFIDFIENSKRYAVVNTGLLNEYKEDVYIIYQYHVGKNMYIPYKIIRSKQDWIENDFSRDVIGKVAPIRFYEGSNFIGHISYEDIDIPDGVFNQILKENKFAKPRNMSLNNGKKFKNRKKQK